jgi:hypothetical protein
LITIFAAMNTTRSLIIAAASVTLMLGCATQLPRTVPPPAQSVRVGAYQPVDVADAEVATCAAVAVTAQEPKGSVTLDKVLDAERQVVAGANYKLRLSVLRNGKRETVETVVWKKLDGTRQVTSFTTIGR